MAKFGHFYFLIPGSPVKDKPSRIIRGAKMFCNETDKSLITFTECPYTFQSWLYFPGDEYARTTGVYLASISRLEYIKRMRTNE
jgi:hypothetical protein